MRPCLCLIALLLVCATVAQADEPTPLFDGCRWIFPRLRDEWRQRCCWCPDDYCPKSLPCVPCNLKGCVDDYCPKSLPCAACNAKGCVDDYWPKTCPIFLWKPCSSCLSCGPLEENAGPCRRCQSKP